MNQTYLDTVRLLLDIAPTIFQSPYFAMKGGTAINLFVQDLPRLSVDIDVVFIDYGMDRDSALKTIADELATARKGIESMGYRANLRTTKEGDEVKVFVSSQDTLVKIEVNLCFGAHC